MSETLQKEFQAAQIRLAELTSEQRRVIENIARKEHEQRMSSLTLKQLEALPNDNAVYRTIGKAFVKSDMGEVQERLKNVGNHATVERENLTTRKSQLQESIVQAEQKAKNLYKELQSN